ncbi:MAG: Rrf2 family transcriptional regulator [bacterium]|nr:Rrf2 family transcriptional regulator [bacterium]
MLSMSQTAGYAIMALSCLDPIGEQWVQEKDIAERTGITRPYLSKLLYNLGQSGLIQSKRGYKGGLALARPAGEISMLDVADAVDGVEWRSRCMMGLPVCGGGNPCPMHEFWLKQRSKIEKALSDIKLDKVIQFQKTGWRLA